MASSIFFGGSVTAAVVAGMIALFAPCCISFMLPAYFASAFQHRRMLVTMTFLFAAGVATIILPIALGASFLRLVFTTLHPWIYVTGGLLMLGLAAYTLLGGQIHLPMPGAAGHPGERAGPWTVYTLGVFSGVTSSCCAPVLAGVIALASVAPSFGIALGLGSAYVFGMVAPLFAISLLWERYDWRSSGLFKRKKVTWRIGALRRTIGLTDVAAVLLLAALGVGMIWAGFTYRSMSSLAPWQVSLSAQLHHYGHLLTRAFTWMPNWVAATLLFIALGVLARHALRQVGLIKPAGRADDGSAASTGAVAQSVCQAAEKEVIHE
jgi:cytochrome c biogenesis protein CcdA